MKIEWDKFAGRGWFIFGVVVLVAIPAGLAYIGLGLIGFLLAVPLLAWFASRILIHGGSGLVTWMSHKQLEEWQGSYYAFNEVQVRIFEDEDRLLFVADDVVTAVGLPRLPDSFLIAHKRDLATVPGTKLRALDPTGVEHLLGKRNDHDAIRFLQWMQREVVRPWAKRRGNA